MTVVESCQARCQPAHQDWSSMRFSVLLQNTSTKSGGGVGIEPAPIRLLLDAVTSTVALMDRAHYLLLWPLFHPSSCVSSRESEREKHVSGPPGALVCFCPPPASDMNIISGTTARLAFTRQLESVGLERAGEKQGDVFQ